MPLALEQNRVLLVEVWKDFLKLCIQSPESQCQLRLWRHVNIFILFSPNYQLSSLISLINSFNQCYSLLYANISFFF